MRDEATGRGGRAPILATPFLVACDRDVKAAVLQLTEGERFPRPATLAGPGAAPSRPETGRSCRSWQTASPVPGLEPARRCSSPPGLGSRRLLPGPPVAPPLWHRPPAALEHMLPTIQLVFAAGAGRIILATESRLVGKE